VRDRAHVHRKEIVDGNVDNIYSLSSEVFIIVTRSRSELLRIYITHIYIPSDVQNYFTSAQYSLEVIA